MKNIGLVFVAILGAVGCSSSDDASGARGVSATTSAARARFTSGATATLTKANGSRALSETKRQGSSGASALKGNPLGGSSDGSSTKSLATRSLHILGAGDLSLAEAGGSSSVGSTCADITAEKDKGSCDCPGGGKLAYDVPNLKALQTQSASVPEEVDMALTYQACVMDGTKYDGSLGILMSKKSVVKVDAKESSAGAPAAGGMNMLIVANDLSIGGEKLDFAFAMDGGRFYYAPSVDDKGGYVLSELSFSGDTKVHAKNGTFDCTVDADGVGECKNESSGETIAVEPGAATGSSDGADAPAPTEP
ncbi:hypothetical protein BH11MYX4_BH11MYX4_54010 [soil metagenome]